MALKNGSYTTDKTTTTMPQISIPSSDLEESTSTVDTCVLCGCVLSGSTEKRYKKLQVWISMVRYCWLCGNA
jgi:hypothetical protein